MLDDFEELTSLVETLKPRAVVERLSEVVREHITWMWNGILPKGKLVIIDGMPGVGKSTLTADIAAKVSMGTPFPCGTSTAPRGVLFLAVEDGVADTIKPRVEAAGGDSTRVYSMAVVISGGEEITPDLSLHMELIRQQVIEKDIGLIIIDPIMALLGSKVDSYRDQDVRTITTPLAKLAGDLDVVVLAVRHPNKSGSSNALLRGGGSMGFIGAARVGLVVGKDPDDESQRVLAIAKNNLASDEGSFIFRLINDVVFGCARVEWLGRSLASADDLYAEPNQEERNQTDEAVEWLRDFLGQKEIDSKLVKQKAADSGISEKPLRRARIKIVQVKRFGQGIDHVSLWSLMPSLSTYAPENEGISEQPGHEWRVDPMWPESQGDERANPNLWAT